MLWHLKRVALSALILMHLAAVFIWSLPECALRTRLSGWCEPYLLMTGQWQHWGMFAPDPTRDTMALEAAGRDARGTIHTHVYPRAADLPMWEAALKYRHSKFAHNMGPEQAIAYREFAARHAVRMWDLPEEAFPVELDLYYRTWRSRRLDEPEPEFEQPPVLEVIQAYRFDARAEVEP